jgi:hypothetical protein
VVFFFLRLSADHLAIGRWRDFDGLLQQAVKQFAARSGSASVKTERELVQVIIQVGGLHGSLMRAQQPALEERGHAMHSRQEPARCVLVLLPEQDCLLVPIAQLFESFPGSSAVGVNEAALFDRSAAQMIFSFV